MSPLVQRELFSVAQLFASVETNPFREQTIEDNPSTSIVNDMNVSITTTSLDTINATSPSPSPTTTGTSNVPSPTNEESLAQLDHSKMTEEENDTTVNESFLECLKDKSDTYLDEWLRMCNCSNLPKTKNVKIIKLKYISMQPKMSNHLYSRQ